MSVPGWLNGNAFRSYPFLESTGGPPDELAVDFGCLLGPEGGFDPALNAVWLAEVRRVGDRFEFYFATDAPGLAAAVLGFSCAADADEFSTLDGSTDPPGQSASSDVGDCPRAFTWEGFLVVGRLEAVRALLPGDGSLLYADREVTVEPARVQGLNGLVRTVNAANLDRSRVTSAAGCPDALVPRFPSTPPFVVARCLTGDVRLAEGYNAVIRQQASDNRVTIAAGVGGGAGRPCREVPVFRSEEPPADSVLLSGGPACEEVIGSINGLTGPRVEVRGGTGVRIEAGEHTLFVHVDLHGLAVCLASASSPGGGG